MSDFQLKVAGDKNLQLGLMSLFQEYQSKLKTPSTKTFSWLSVADMSPQCLFNVALAPAGLGFLYWVFHPAEEAAEMTEEGVQCRNLEVFEKNRLRWHHGGYCRSMIISKHLAAGNQDTMGNTDVMLQDHSEEQTMRMRKPHGTAMHLSATA